MRISPVQKMIGVDAAISYLNHDANIDDDFEDEAVEGLIYTRSLYDAMCKEYTSVKKFNGMAMRDFLSKVALVDSFDASK